MAKKSFRENINPAEQFISIPEERAEQRASSPTGTTPAIPDGYKLVSTELKNKRVQLVFRKSTHKKATARAKELGLSLNEYIHQLIEEDTKEN